MQTFQTWAEQQRRHHIPKLTTRYVEDTPTHVVRMKKHPAMLKLIERYVAELTAREVLAPLGMTRASFDWTGESMPVGHDLRGRPVAPYVYSGRASGGLHATAADIAWQIADALYYAHGQGVVHRDVKSSNILITADDRAFLTDFGVAQARVDNAKAEVIRTKYLYIFRIKVIEFYFGLPIVLN